MRTVPDNVESLVDLWVESLELPQAGQGRDAVDPHRMGRLRAAGFALRVRRRRERREEVCDLGRGDGRA